MRLVGPVSILVLLMVAATVQATESGPAPLGGMAREFDARVAFNQSRDEPQAPAGQLQALATLEQQLGALHTTRSTETGATRSMMQRGGYLTTASNADPELVVAMFLANHHQALGLSSDDIASLELQDRVPSRPSGATHLYYQQHIAGLPVYNAQLQAHVNRDGRLLFLSHDLLPAAVDLGIDDEPRISPLQAVTSLAEHLGYSMASEPTAISQASRHWQVAAPGLSDQAIDVHLAWLPVRAGDLRLVWRFQVRPAHRTNHFDVTVDAKDATVWTRFDWVDEANYRAFQQPVESPIHSSMPPPADGRVVVSDPEDPVASPLGWHDDGTTSFTITRGNNVHAVDDASSGNPSPDCGAGLNCDFEFPIPFGTADPRDYIDASVANLFYWVNIAHDVMYHYGFDEVSGNFQANNFGNGGVGNDPVDALGQSNNFRCPNNAFFGTPPDGGSGNMIMCLWTNSNPRRDFSWDSGVMIHEFAHGISNRLVGGPSNSSCITGAQRPGEGYSDWYGLVFTALPSHTGATTRGSGTYILGQPINGPGVRPQPYSTDPAVNSYTYESIQGLSQPHGVGSVLAQVAWEVYWALVERHGFDPDLYNALGGSGNQRAIFYMTEALKMVPCSHTFADVRDAMLQAAADNFGGADVCPMWEAFAGIGLGEDADPANPNSLNVTNGFAIPESCLFLFADSFEANP